MITSDDTNTFFLPPLKRRVQDTKLKTQNETQINKSIVNQDKDKSQIETQIKTEAEIDKFLKEQYEKDLSRLKSEYQGHSLPFPTLEAEEHRVQTGVIQRILKETIEAILRHYRGRVKGIIDNKTETDKQDSNLKIILYNLYAEITDNELKNEEKYNELIASDLFVRNYLKDIRSILRDSPFLKKTRISGIYEKIYFTQRAKDEAPVDFRYFLYDSYYDGYFYDCPIIKTILLDISKLPEKGIHKYLTTQKQDKECKREQKRETDSGTRESLVRQ